VFSHVCGCSDGKTAMHLVVQGVTTGEHLHIVRSLFDVTTGESQMRMKDKWVQLLLLQILLF
jgi:hypothetical protein